MNILITGINSKLGTPIINRLRDNHHIIAVIRSKQNLKGVIEGVEYLELDLVKGIEYEGHIDYIIHLASFVPYNYESDKDTFQASFTDNVTMTDNLLKLAVAKNIKKFIFTSSIDVYGSNAENSLSETSNCSPDNYYGLSKIAGEDLLNVYYHNYNIHYSIFRISYVIGSTMGEDRFLKSLLNSIKKSKDLTLYNPNNILNIIHIDEVTNALEKSINGANGIYNLSKHISLFDFVNIAQKQLRSTSKINYIDNQDTSLKKLDNRKIIQYYGDIFLSFEDSIARTMRLSV